MHWENQAEPHVLEWCLPVIHDCLVEFYRDIVPAANGAREAMTGRHFALWTALIQDDFEHLPADRHLLETQAKNLGVDCDVWAAADRHVAAEILDISLRRFRRMPHEARINNAALLNLLKNLHRDENRDAGRATLAQAAQRIEPAAQKIHLAR